LAVRGQVRPGIVGPMETPPPDPAKLLDAWMAWERGETTPGKVMSELKTAGLPDLLRSLATPAASAVE
jgi:hypothetical protein